MVFNRGNGSEPHSIDPQIAEGVPSSHIQRDLFEGLVAEDSKGELVPGVAKNWDVSDDGKTYTFHLRDTKWSDGSPFTADDVVYALQRLVDPAVGSTYSFIIYPIVNAKAIAEGEEKDLNKLGVKAIDPHTVEITLNSPTPYFLGLLTHSSTYPVPKAVVEKYGKEWTRKENIVSNGPFKMAEWVPNSKMTLVKSDNYWDKDAVKLDKVVFYPIEDQNAELKRYRAGELDWTYEIPNDQIKWLKANLADELKIEPYLGVYYYGFNLTKAPFKDNPKLREALSLAIDRKVLTEKVTGAGELPAYNFIPPGVLHYKSYEPEIANWSREKQIEEAKKLYAEAGYSKEHPLKLELVYNTSENHKKIAVAIAAMWKQVLGVQTDLVNQEWKVYLQNRREKNTQAFRAGWIGDYNDPYTFLELFQSNAGGLNDPGYANADFDKYVADAANIQDLDERAKVLQQAEKQFVNDTAVMPIYHYVTKRLVKPYVKGYDINIMDHSRSKYITVEK
ncbi:peptide ABC transporter substrate-binding protein [Suttonella ornithocola]|nr:peptide ABC transporter substrate-binding protein [Suttonella ornithocola]